MAVESFAEEASAAIAGHHPDVLDPDDGAPILVEFPPLEPQEIRADLIRTQTTDRRGGQHLIHGP